jgi:CRP/FNR family transcriptional regulator, anaerobic regulatory protein
MGILVRDAVEPEGGCLRAEPVSHCATCHTRFLAVCSAFEDHELSAFDRIVQHRCHAAKAALFEQGQNADFVFSVSEGVVRLFRLLADGRRQIIGFALPGDFLGVSLPMTHDYCAEAVNAIRVCRIPRNAFVSLVDEKPHLLRKLHEFACRDMRTAREQMVLLGRKTAEERVAAFLLTMRERWARVSHCSVTVPLPMSRVDIADYLGLTIETVSRTISKLARDKAIVVVPDGVRLLDIPRLQAVGAN